MGESAMVSGTGPLAAGITQAVITTVTGAMLPIVTRYGATHIDPLLIFSDVANWRLKK